jgi:hypothetical protein
MQFSNSSSVTNDASLLHQHLSTSSRKDMTVSRVRARQIGVEIFNNAATAKTLYSNLNKFVLEWFLLKIATFMQ